MRSIPSAMLDMLLRVGGRRRVRPWISYQAVEEIERLIRTDWRVLEFGSGMSTIWFAERVSFVLSIESDPGWSEWVLAQLHQRRLTNVAVRIGGVNKTDGVFDFVFIDGIDRANCVAPALNLLRAGGYLYIDNTDADGQDAVDALRLIVPSVELSYYTDLAPGVAFPTTGALARIH